MPTDAPATARTPDPDPDFEITLPADANAPTYAASATPTATPAPATPADVIPARMPEGVARRDEMLRIADSVARLYYDRLVSAHVFGGGREGWISRDDLRNEAFCALLTAEARGWNTSRGCLWRAATIHLMEYLYRAGAPVCEAKGRLKSLATAGRADAEVAEHVPAAGTPEEALAQHQWTRMVADRLAAILSKHPVAAAVLHGARPQDVARARRSGRMTVYRAADRARRALRADEGLARLWADR